MPTSALRTIVQIALAAIATNAAVACSSAETIADEPAASPPPPSPESAPLPDASSQRIDGITTERGWKVDAGPGLPNATCQPNCLPVDWLADVLRAGGLEVWEDPDWHERGHGSFLDLWGVFAHHTGDEDEDAWKVVRDGRSDLKGPLSQLVLEKNGLFRVVAAGVAWHAGAGSYPGLETNRANFRTLGIEAVNTGLESWSVMQYTAYVRGVAAILKYLQLDSSRVIGHKEWAGVAQGKWDPGGIDMNVFRADVQAILDN